MLGALRAVDLVVAFDERSLHKQPRRPGLRRQSFRPGRLCDRRGCRGEDRSRRWRLRVPGAAHEGPFHHLSRPPCRRRREGLGSGYGPSSRRLESSLRDAPKIHARPLPIPFIATGVRAKRRKTSMSLGKVARRSGREIQIMIPACRWQSVD